MVTAATIHMAIVGPQGLRQVALQSHANTNRLVEILTANEHVEKVFDRPSFHEAVLRFNLNLNMKGILRPLYAHNLLPGYELDSDYSELGNTLLVCATDARTNEDIDLYADHLNRIIERQTTAGCPVQPKM